MIQLARYRLSCSIAFAAAAVFPARAAVAGRLSFGANVAFLAGIQQTVPARGRCCSLRWLHLAGAGIANLAIVVAIGVFLTDFASFQFAVAADRRWCAISLGLFFHALAFVTGFPRRAVSLLFALFQSFDLPVPANSGGRASSLSDLQLASAKPALECLILAISVLFAHLASIQFPVSAGRSGALGFARGGAAI